MKRLLVRWALMVVALVLSAAITSSLGLVFRANVEDAADVLQLFVAVAVLTFLNATLGRLLKLLTLPLNCLTLGLVSLVINAAMLNIVSNLHLGVEVKGFLAAFVGSVFLSVINSMLATLLPDADKHD